ncbi:MAG: class I SAM-dependent methyltransferase [Thermoplasmata archaeon]
MRWPLAWSSRPSSAWLQRLPGRRIRLRDLLRAAERGLPAEAVVYDAGGGTGYPLRLFSAAEGGRSHRTYVLAEPQREMRDRAHRVAAVEGAPEIRRVQADGVALPFRDASADLVLSIGVLCCTAPEAVPRAIREIDRVLRRGGRLAFAVPRRHGAEMERLLMSGGFHIVERVRRNRTLFEKG